MAIDDNCDKPGDRHSPRVVINILNLWSELPLNMGSGLACNRPIEVRPLLS
jgi:hypothetical protein